MTRSRLRKPEENHSDSMLFSTPFISWAREDGSLREASVPPGVYPPTDRHTLLYPRVCIPTLPARLKIVLHVAVTTCLTSGQWSCKQRGLVMALGASMTSGAWLLLTFFFSLFHGELVVAGIILEQSYWAWSRTVHPQSRTPKSRVSLGLLHSRLRPK